MTIIMLGVWVILGLGLSIWAGSLWKGYRPYGETVDHIVAVVSCILIGLMDWYLVPMIMPDASKLIVFLAAILEPAVGVLLIFWIMRKIKPQQAE